MTEGEPNILRTMVARIKTLKGGGDIIVKKRRLVL